MEFDQEGYKDPYKYKLTQDFLLEVEKRYALQPSQNMEFRISRMCSEWSTKEVDELLQRLRTLPSDHPEWQLIVEGLTVHETYFGRDRNAMNALRNVILPQILKNKDNREINIWSAGCSTGEEAYNLAILVMEALYYFETKNTGPVPDRYFTSHMWKINIVGTDVSMQVLRIAENGVYNDSIMGSFRSAYNDVLPYFTIDHCDANDRGGKTIHYKIKDYFKTIVKFKQRNLFTKILQPSCFDLIMCRNVMIYFNDKNKRVIQETLDANLVDNGILLLGSVDTLFLSNYKARLEDHCLWYEKNRSTVHTQIPAYLEQGTKSRFPGVQKSLRTFEHEES